MFLEAIQDCIESAKHLGHAGFDLSRLKHLGKLLTESAAEVVIFLRSLFAFRSRSAHNKQCASGYTHRPFEIFIPMIFIEGGPDQDISHLSASSHILGICLAWSNCAKDATLIAYSIRGCSRGSSVTDCIKHIANTRHRLKDLVCDSTVFVVKYMVGSILSHEVEILLAACRDDIEAVCRCDLDGIEANARWNISVSLC